MTRCELLVTKTDIAPPVPAGTIAMLAVTAPVGAFSVEAKGRVCPVGQVVRNPRPPLGPAVIFTTSACAVAGMPQPLDNTGKLRSAPPTNCGPPNGPLALRVSA